MARWLEPLPNLKGSAVSIHPSIVKMEAYKGAANSTEQPSPPRPPRVSVVMEPGTSGLQREAHCAAGIQQQQTTAPPAPRVVRAPRRRRQRDEEVDELLGQTCRAGDLAEARNRQDAEFQARLLEHLNEAAAERRRLTAAVSDLAAAVREAREESLHVHEWLVVTISFMVLLMQNQVQLLSN